MERYSPEVCEDLLKAEYSFPDIAPGTWRNQETESEKVRLFVDMDGTLAMWHPTKKLEELYEEGYFKN